MAKELTDNNVPGNVFQLFNENRTYYFESDISSLPMPPCTVIPPPPPSMPKLRKSFSQPQLSTTDCLNSVSSRTLSDSPNSQSSLHLPSAVMASTSLHVPAHSHISRDGSGSPSSLETRYQTEPSYGSSRILKSFRNEFKLFGNIQSQNARQSVSNPTSPRRDSSLEQVSNEKQEMRPRTSSDPRKLSLVKEETVDQITSETSGVVALCNSKDIAVKSPTEKPKVMSAVATDTVDGQSMTGQRLPLTRQMMDWFTTSQPQVNVNRSEFNAITPSSF